MFYYVLTHLVFIVFTMVILPVVVLWRFGGRHEISHEPLGLPKGTVRSLLALSIVGSFLISLSLGPLFLDESYFHLVVGSHGTLIGGAVAYYFASRSVSGPAQKKA